MADDDNPKTGDTWACDTCGMAILLTEDCNCEDGAPFFSCCGAQMEQTGSKAD